MNLPPEFAALPRCRALTKAGQQCRTNATSANGYCFWHDEDRAEQARAAHAAGGRAMHARRAVQANRERVRSPEELSNFRADVVHAMREGTLPLAAARSLLWASRQVGAPPASRRKRTRALKDLLAGLRDIQTDLDVEGIAVTLPELLREYDELIREQLSVLDGSEENHVDKWVDLSVRLLAATEALDMVTGRRAHRSSI